jgi:uncharacterized damage-inducible protein DinB
MKQIYVEYGQYNLWANKRLTEVFSSLPEEIVEQPLPSSFPSVKLTLLHIWDAEFLWLNRLQGVSPSDFPSKGFAGDLNETLSGLLNTSENFLEFIESQPEDFFEKTLHFRTISFGDQRERAFMMVHHCLNHSTYHRGQLVTMARQLGIERIPATDLIYFLREKF